MSRITNPTGAYVNAIYISSMERYRSGHNGADSKSDGRVIPAREFESHPLRHLSQEVLTLLISGPPQRRSEDNARQGGPVGARCEATSNLTLSATYQSRLLIRKSCRQYRRRCAAKSNTPPAGAVTPCSQDHPIAILEKSARLR